jgi:hypothetical protein
MTEETDKVPITQDESRITLSDLPHVKADEYVSFYANFAQGGQTPWDISITFSRIGDLEGRTVVLDLATVTFTPALAKAVVAVIQANINGYEEQFGEVPLPKGLVAPHKVVRSKGGQGAASEPSEAESK